MKIKNDLVSIKIGKKQYDFKNLILNEYLNTFARAQLNKDDIYATKNNKNLQYLLIKFDTPLENITEERTLNNDDFDIVLVLGETSLQEINENGITVQYTYELTENSVIIDYNTNETIYYDISKFYGKKITALGFNRHFTTLPNAKVNVCAVLDTSNYNIYLQEKQEFTVTRKDIITTDAIFFSNDKSKIAGPIHLAPIPNKALIKPNKVYNDTGNRWYTGSDESFGIIYSIGLSSYVDRIDKEFVIGEDVEITQNGAELETKGFNNAISKEFMHPNENIYPSSNLYPTKSNYKYLIIKYKVWQELLSGTYDNPVYTITDTGYFYHQAIPIRKFGDLDLKIKYERG